MLLIRNFVIPVRLVTMLLIFYEYGNMRVHLCYKCYYMRRKDLKFDSDSLQDKLNHKIFHASCPIIYTCSLIYLSQIWLTVNIKNKKFYYTFYILKAVFIGAIYRIILFSHLYILINNYDISSYLSTSGMLFLSIFTGDRLNFLWIK